MTNFLVQLGFMSLKATVIIGVVLILRFLFSGLHIAKKYVIFLWVIPYIAMVIPWGIKAPFSFWNLTLEEQTKVEQAINTIPYNSEKIVQADIDADILNVMEDNRYAPPSLENIQNAYTGAQDKEISASLDEVLEQYKEQRERKNTSGFWGNLTTWDVFIYSAFGVWFWGFFGFMMYGVLSSLKLKKKLICSLCLEGDVYVADDIREPFVFGVISPKIYLPCNLTKDNEYYVVEHEKTHIQRKDPLKKVIAFFITGIHWFNPFAYVAFHMMTKDMEMACDEETVQRIGVAKRQDYASALLNLSTKKRNMLIPVAFGEGNVRLRIKNVIKYKKTMAIVGVFAAVLIVMVAVVFLSKPVEKTVSLSKWNGDDVMGVPGEDNRRNVLLTYEGKEYFFEDSHYDDFRLFLEGMVIYKEEVNKSRSETRPRDVIIQFEEGGPTYNFDKELRTFWYDNNVKPSKTYEIVEPIEVAEFLEEKIGDLEVKVFEEEISTETDDIKQYPGNIADISNYCGENGPFLDYADDTYVVFHTLDRFFVYDIGQQEVSIGIKFNDIFRVLVDAENLTAYIHDVTGDMITIYDCDIVNRVCGTDGLMDVNAFDDFFVTAECVLHDPTVFRTKNCVQVADGSYLYLQSGSGMLEDLSLIKEDKAGKQTVYEIFDADTFDGGTDAKIQLFNAACYMELIDLTHDGRREYVIVDVEDLLDDGQGQAYLKVADETGEVFWQAELGLPRAGWNSYYLVYTKEGACLLQYLPVVMQERGEYSYRLFYLEEDGSEVEVFADSVNFSFYPNDMEMSAEDAIPKEEMLKFAENVNRYLDGARLLVGTVDGVLKYQTPSKTYSYKEVFEGALKAVDVAVSENAEVNITKLQNYYETCLKE